MVVKPKPGKSGAMMWWLPVVDREGIRLRYWWEEEGKPWRRRRTGAVGGPAER